MGWPSEDQPLSQYIVVKDCALCEGTPFLHQIAAAYLRNGFFLVYLSAETPWYSLYLNLRKLGIRLDSSQGRKRILFFDAADPSETNSNEDYPDCFMEHVAINIRNGFDWIGQICNLMDKYLSERRDPEHPLPVAVMLDSSTSISFLNKESDTVGSLFHYLRVMEQKLAPTIYCVCQLVHFDMGYGEELLQEAKFYDSLVLHLDALSLGASSEQDGRLSVEDRDQVTYRVLFKILENQIKLFTI